VFVDLLLNAIPVRLLHGIYVVIYGVIYIIFTAIFYAAGNHAAIYPAVLDWGMPGRTAAYNVHYTEKICSIYYHISTCLNIVFLQC
jgi:hypothetical protein